MQKEIRFSAIILPLFTGCANYPLSSFKPQPLSSLFLKFLNIFIAAGPEHYKQNNYTATAITPLGKCYCQLAAKIFNCPTFIWFFKPLCKERKRGSFVNWNTLHAKRRTRCSNTWPFSIIVAGMKCSIQSSLSGDFFLCFPLMNKAHFRHVPCSFGFVSFKGDFAGTGCNLTSF